MQPDRPRTYPDRRLPKTLRHRERRSTSVGAPASAWPRTSRPASPAVASSTLGGPPRTSSHRSSSSRSRSTSSRRNVRVPAALPARPDRPRGSGGRSLPTLGAPPSARARVGGLRSALAARERSRERSRRPPRTSRGGAGLGDPPTRWRVSTSGPLCRVRVRVRRLGGVVARGSASRPGRARLAPDYRSRRCCAVPQPPGSLPCSFREDAPELSTSQRRLLGALGALPAGRVRLRALRIVRGTRRRPRRPCGRFGIVLR
jgi:hypothetical protein